MSLPHSGDSEFTSFIRKHLKSWADAFSLVSAFGASLTCPDHSRWRRVKRKHGGVSVGRWMEDAAGGQEAAHLLPGFLRGAFAVPVEPSQRGRFQRGREEDAERAPPRCQTLVECVFDSVAGVAARRSSGSFYPY